MSININDIIIGKKIGEGFIGTIYLATHKNKKYALKIEHILEKNIKKSLKSQVWRENEFANTLGKKYPDQFMILYDYKITDSCKHIQKIPNANLSKKVKQHLQELAESEYCIMRLYSYVDTTLENIITKLSLKQRFSMIIQVSYIVYLMQKHGYKHTDFHYGNIGVKYTHKSSVKILDKKIPTFGYIYCAIDYGLVLNKKYKLSKDEKYRFDTKNDLKNLFATMYNDDKLIKYWLKLVNSKKLIYDYDADIKLFDKTLEQKILEKITDDKNIQFELFSIIFPDAFQKILLKQYVPKKPFDVILYIPLEQIIHFASIINEPKKCIEYFYDKLSII